MSFIVPSWFALAVAGALFILWLWRQLRSVAIAGMLWLGYGGYEYLMQTRVICSGGCDIRVDLLFLYPILFAALVAALWAAIRGRTPPL
jgi:hypothetical protein